MTILNTVITVLMIVLGVSAAAALAIAAWMGGARSAQSGPPYGALERDDDEEQR